MKWAIVSNNEESGHHCNHISHFVQWLGIRNVLNLNKQTESFIVPIHTNIWLTNPLVMYQYKSRHSRYRNPTINMRPSYLYNATYYIGESSLCWRDTEFRYGDKVAVSVVSCNIFSSTIVSTIGATLCFTVLCNMAGCDYTYKTTVNTYSELQSFRQREACLL